MGTRFSLSPDGYPRRTITGRVVRAAKASGAIGRHFLANETRNWCVQVWHRNPAQDFGAVVRAKGHRAAERAALGAM